MASYRGTGRNERAKALTAVIAVHAAIGAALLIGLNVETVTRTVERLRTFNIEEPAAPPPPPPSPPRIEDSGAPVDEAAPANLKSEATPVVAPPARMPPPIPLPATQTPGTDSERSTGASNLAGPGTGAGGQGSGTGGGGSGGTGRGPGSGAGFIPAQRVSKIPDSAYRQIRALSGRRSGSIGITLKVNTDGSASNCRIARSSGDGAVDSLFCDLAVRHVRFRPARDPQGQPVAQDVTWYPDWSPR